MERGETTCATASVCWPFVELYRSQLEVVWEETGSVCHCRMTTTTTMIQGWPEPPGCWLLHQVAFLAERTMPLDCPRAYCNETRTIYDQAISDMKNNSKISCNIIAGFCFFFRKRRLGFLVRAKDFRCFSNTCSQNHVHSWTRWPQITKCLFVLDKVRPDKLVWFQMIHMFFLCGQQKLQQEVSNCWHRQRPVGWNALFDKVLFSWYEPAGWLRRFHFHVAGTGRRVVFAFRTTLREFQRVLQHILQRESLRARTVIHEPANWWVCKLITGNETGHAATQLCLEPELSRRESNVREQGQLNNEGVWFNFASKLKRNLSRVVQSTVPSMLNTSKLKLNHLEHFGVQRRNSARNLRKQTFNTLKLHVYPTHMT